MAQRHLVAHEFVFHGILQGRVQEYFHFLALDESHLDDAFTESAMTLYLYNDTAFACLQF